MSDSRSSRLVTARWRTRGSRACRIALAAIGCIAVASGARAVETGTPPIRADILVGADDTGRLCVVGRRGDDAGRVVLCENAQLPASDGAARVLGHLQPVTRVGDRLEAVVDAHALGDLPADPVAAQAYVRRAEDLLVILGGCSNELDCGIKVAENDLEAAHVRRETLIDDADKALDELREARARGEATDGLAKTFASLEARYLANASEIDRCFDDLEQLRQAMDRVQDRRTLVQAQDAVAHEVARPGSTK